MIEVICLDCHCQFECDCIVDTECPSCGGFDINEDDYCFDDED